MKKKIMEFMLKYRLGLFFLICGVLRCVTELAYCIKTTYNLTY